MTKVHLGVLLTHGFPVPSAFVEGYSLLLQNVLQGTFNHLLPPERRVEQARVTFMKDFPVDYARNKTCRLVLDHDTADYLLFLDADMRHPPDVVHRLLAREVDVVTARYVMRKPPFFTVAMRKVGAGATDYQAIEKLVPSDEVRGLMEIDAGGAGALLVSRRALRAIRERIGDDWFRYQDGPDGLRSRSEDMWFYEQAVAAGFQPYLDADVSCTHIAQFEVDEKFHAPYAGAYQRARNQQHEEVRT